MLPPNQLLYSPGANDECYTPDYAVKPILPFVNPSDVIWCPFDTDESQFVKLLQANGNRVIASHITTGQDFYQWQPAEP